jgi:carbonic anhydrase
MHVPGEHELNGRGFTGELHLVHQEVGATGTNGLLVVGRWLVVHRSWGRPGALDKYFDAFPDHTDADTVVRTVTRFNLTRLLPSDDDDDDLDPYRYDGSLTAGAVEPFPEGVKWNVLKRTMAVTEEQIEKFAELFEEGNAREVQPLYGRKVFSDRD